MKPTIGDAYRFPRGWAGAAAIAIVLLGGQVATASTPSQLVGSDGRPLVPYSTGAAVSPTALYSPAIQVDLESGTHLPQLVSNNWRIFGGTFFLKGATGQPDDFAQTGKSKLIMQKDGNFVLYDETGRGRWASNTRLTGLYAVFQKDGNLVVYNSQGRSVWASNTCCHTNYFFAVQADGNLVIYDSGGGVHWASHTNH